MKKCRVEIERLAEKQLHKLPAYIRDALDAWRKDVELSGIWNARRRPGYHDEPLKGRRQGQRSVRLSRAYRAFYMESEDGEVHVVAVLEVNKHDY